MENFRIVLNEIEGFIDNQDGATESQLKSLWNGLSNAITDYEFEIKNSNAVEIWNNAQNMEFKEFINWMDN